MINNPIILNNSGNDDYAFVARDWSINAVKVKYLRIILDSSTELTKTLEIKNRNSTGYARNRRIPLSSYTNAENKTDLILLIPFDTELILDGKTYFTMNIPASSQIIMMFYYVQNPVEDKLSK
jgi:hypothetical protein